ncbi:MAG: hypothetical protein ACRCWY_11460 [Cellulosilyticaceae bacterium]
MKHKRKIAWGLVVALVASIFPNTVYANSQNGIAGIRLTGEELTHTYNTTQEILHPTIEIAWEAPESKATDGNELHEVEFYKVQVKEFGNGSMPTKIMETKNLGNINTFKIGPETQFYINGIATSEKVKSGGKYEVYVLAGHSHYREVNGIQEKYEVWSTRNEEKLTVVTDFNTKVTTAEEGLKVTWEYIPNMDYKLYYIKDEKGLHKTKKAILEAKPKASEKTITAQEAEKLKVVKNGRTYVEYTIKGLDPRAKYSLFVEPIIDKSLGIYTNAHTDAKGPKVVSGMTAITLAIELMSATSLKLVWGVIQTEAFGSGLERVVAEARPKGEGGDFETIAEKNNIDSAVNHMTHIVVDRPEVETEFRVAFYFKDQKEPIYSNIVIYTPIFEVVPPYSPKVPELYIKELAENNAIKRAKYLVTGDKIAFDDEVNWKDSKFIARTFHAAFTPEPYIQVVWDAPKKPSQEDPKKQVVDYDLVYDLWIGESFDEVSKPTYEGLVVENQRIVEGDTTHLIGQHQKEDEIIGMKWQLTKDANGEPIKKNKTYYIKIVAKKRIPGGDTYVASQPTVVGLTIDKNGNITKPSVMGKPPLGIKKDSVTETAMTIEWATLWAEILANNPKIYQEDEAEMLLAETGASIIYKVANDGEKPIRFKPQDAAEVIRLYGRQKDAIEDIIGKLPMEHYYSRFLTLGKDVQYEVAVETYDTLYSRLNGVSIEKWMKDVAKDDKNSGLLWEGIQPKERTEIESAHYNVWLEQEINHTTNDGQSFKPNTRYIIMLRAYRMIDGVKVAQSFPSYVMGTTLTDFPPIEPKPIAPTIEVVDETDHSLDVEWTYNRDFDYELRYSIGDDPEKAKVWKFTSVDDVKLHDPSKNMYYFVDGQAARVTIRGLFPETYYNVWVRAKQKKGSLVSEWSTPDTGCTDPLAVPDVPRGLGPASKQSLKDLGLEYDPVGSDYITIEWMKNPDDLGVQTEGTMKKFYTYDIMFADNVAFEDSTVVTVTDALGSKDSVDFLAKVIAKHNKLLPNRPYYFKVRARVTISDSEINKELSKESEYSKWVRIFTKKTDDEYDGGENENVVIYPDKVEESYNNGIWEWEIVDAQGVITDIVTTNEYFYTIDMTLYKGRYDATIRRAILPVSVVQALVGQRMELEVITNRGIYEIPASALAYKLQKVDAKDQVIVEFETMLAYDLRDLAKPYPHIVESGEALSITVNAKNAGKQKLTYFDAPIDVCLKLENPTSYQRNTYKTYSYDYSKGDWLEAGHMVQTRPEGTYLSYRSTRPGIYALYRMDTYHEIKDINYAMQQLLANYHIPKLGTYYKQNTSVYSNQYIQLMLGLAHGQREIDLDGYVSDGTKEKARLTKLYVEAGGAVTEEQAIHGAVRLYEMKTGYRVQQASGNFSGVSTKYRESVAKAYALGIIDNVNPQRQITYGDLCTLIIKVLPN